MPRASVPQSLLKRIERIVGAARCTTDPNEIEPYLTDASERCRGRSSLVVRPGCTDEVAEVIRVCGALRVGVVPQGGNTGLVGGGVPSSCGDEVILSLARLKRIRAVDTIGLTATVEAGYVLAHLQAQLESRDLWFPLRLGAEGNCQIGGNLATNAGGPAALRYGNARDLVLGLEVVLANGEVWDGLRRLPKDNTGYDLKQLFLGAEGTLGIITAAVLKLVPRPRQVQTALVAVATPFAAMELFGRIARLANEHLIAFEYLDGTSLALVIEHAPSGRNPFSRPYGHYVLMELASSRTVEDLGLGQCLETVLSASMQKGEVLDAVIAASLEQARAFWDLRESIPRAQRRLGQVIKHDISVPLEHIPAFLERAKDLVSGSSAGILAAAFGHFGDGNIHFNLCPAQREGGTIAQLPDLARISRGLYDLAVGMGGSFSAEHGVGHLRRDELKQYKSPLELRLMRDLKQVLDPFNILNPGKVI
jgi:FAD/FMN-containing dehydrogenase